MLTNNIRLIVHTFTFLNIKILHLLNDKGNNHSPFFPKKNLLFLFLFKFYNMIQYFNRFHFKEHPNWQNKNYASLLNIFSNNQGNIHIDLNTTILKP